MYDLFWLEVMVEGTDPSTAKAERAGVVLQSAGENDPIPSVSGGGSELDVTGVSFRRSQVDSVIAGVSDVVKSVCVAGAMLAAEGGESSG